MSMLAEKRRKQKWSLNPQGKHWLADSNKFGLKILESMGWKEGKGLGKQQDGITEPIKVAFKNDSKGLGLKENASSMQQDHFDALLQSLNDRETKPTKPIASLEKKSQNSRTRVHYKKFMRGKDLSRYSSKDLANIFEKKSLSTPEQSQPECNNVNKGSMTDYFSNKMPSGVKLEKRSRSSSESDTERPSFGFGFQGITNPAFNPAVETHSLNTIVEEGDTLSLNDSSAKHTEEEPPQKVKKRKKGKGAVESGKKRKNGIDNPALNMSVDEVKDKGIDNLALDIDLIAEDLMLNVVEEPVPEQTKMKSSRKKGFHNYGFDVKAQRIEENIGCISRSIETYQAEVENGINEIKDEDLYVGEFSTGDGENQKQKDGVLLRFKYATFTKDPHWTVRYNQTANFAKKSYKHLIKGDIAVAFKESNLHEIKGYGLGNKM